MAKSSRSAQKPTRLERFKAARTLYRASGQWQPQTLDDFDRWMDFTQSSGDQAALTFTAYFSGVMQISQSLATVACPLFKREGLHKRRPWAEHPVFKILNGNANQFVDSLRWRELNFSNAINWGNAYSFMRRDSSNRPFEVTLLESARMTVELKESGEPVYVYKLPKGGTRRFNWTEIFHFMGFGPDPYQGYSLIELHRQALALGLQQQSFSNNFIKNGIHTSGVMTHPAKMDEDAQSRFRKQLKEKLAGASNAGRFLILEEGMTWETMSMPLKDAEFLGGRVFQLQEIARILNIPPHKLKDNSHSTFSNIEEQQIEWVTDTLRPWAERFEKAVDMQMLTPIERSKGFTEHNLARLQRGDMKSVVDALRVQRFAGFINADEGRDELGRNPIDIDDLGTRYLQPSNMMNADSDAAREGGGTTGGGNDEDKEVV